MDTITVRLNPANIRRGSGYIDSGQEHGKRVLAGNRPILIRETALVKSLIARGELILVSGASVNPDPAPAIEAVVVWPESLHPDVVAVLIAQGLTPEKVQAATDEELLAIPGLGQARLKQIRSLIPSLE